MAFKIVRAFSYVVHMMFQGRKRFIIASLGIILGIAAQVIASSTFHGALSRMYLSMSELRVNWVKMEIYNHVDKIALTNFCALNCDTIRAGFPLTAEKRAYRYGPATYKATLYFTMSSYLSHGGTIIKGRPFIDSPSDSLNEIVISEVLADSVFMHESPIGKTIIINNIPFEIVGVIRDSLNEPGIFMGIEDSIRLLQNENVSTWYFVSEYTDIRSIERLQGRLDNYMTAINYSRVKQIHEDASSPNTSNFSDVKSKLFSVNGLDSKWINQYESIEASKSLSTFFSVLLTCIGIIGFFSVLIMISSSKAEEIGIEMALGADKIFICWQCILETILISVFACVAGFIVGTIVTFGVKLIYDSEIALEFDSAWILAIGVILSATLTGIISAFKSLRVDPISAIHM